MHFKICCEGQSPTLTPLHHLRCMQLLFDRGGMDRAKAFLCECVFSGLFYQFFIGEIRNMILLCSCHVQFLSKRFQKKVAALHKCFCCLNFKKQVYILFKWPVYFLLPCTLQNMEEKIVEVYMEQRKHYHGRQEYYLAISKLFINMDNLSAIHVLGVKPNCF